MIEFKLPSLGADMDEGTLLEWRIAPGAAVRRGQVVAVVDTAKAAVDVECWQDGTVLDLLIQPGDKVPVGTPIATLLEEGETAETVQRPAHAAKPARPAAAPRSATSAAPPGSRPRISPAARTRAAELGVDANRLSGTGPQGAVTLADVEAAARQAKPLDRHAAMRQAIAAAMSRSKREIPHYYLAETVPLGAALAWLSAHNAGLAPERRLLPGVLLLKAVALALRDYPQLNGFWQDGAFRPVAGIHLGVAVALRQGGLIAPALHDVADRPLTPLMEALGDLVQRARSGSLRSSELSDATLTVTQLGDQGVDGVFGVIYPPQVALVGVGRLAERPWVEGGKLCVMPTAQFSLAADHRASDGHYGARFLAEVRRLLQTPDSL
ncbi:dihydrolipoamide acetyltransferase family protein [Azotobacter beijerinckii]|uniref:Dihydrolipoamide acetyltransferase component of pyruvate dehydrogenase complex n=1 Tax=Azotobacter beijerinckii TaxID=170623 RepID=A0A1I4GIG7_9GAMM|nr:dihydrolipoamide acetyltransferase family protein [Azotobacter beijerinckii]SFB56882.1 pyruvate dehydrogenase E2 component (dihydrolipoamide acetyltransferase) [Azotobacter beijerinckii]SFL29828.1 pyruvate dehydrogenase E2 component (dihydrolipoamide acetyltransferase) [Azotobacter beijerinckii]